MALDENKELVRRLIEEAVNEQNLDAVDELADSKLAIAAKRWIGPFRISFPHFTMKIVGLVGEGDTVVGHFQCSGTHRGEWNGIGPTGRRFEDIDEIYIFRVREGKLTGLRPTGVVGGPPVRNRLARKGDVTPPAVTRESGSWPVLEEEEARTRRGSVVPVVRQLAALS